MSQHFIREKILWPSNMDILALTMQSEKSTSRPYGGRSRTYQVGMNLEVQQNKALGGVDQQIVTDIGTGVSDATVGKATVVLLRVQPRERERLCTRREKVLTAVSSG